VAGLGDVVFGALMFVKPNELWAFRVTIENYAYRDRFGRETVTCIRTFSIKQPRRFDTLPASIDLLLGRRRGILVTLRCELDKRRELATEVAFIDP